MTPFDKLITRGLKRCESAFPSTIKIGGVEYVGTFSDLSIEDSAAFGGIESTATAIFILRKELFSTQPVDKSAVIINGKRRKISGVTDDAGSWNIGISE